MNDKKEEPRKTLVSDPEVQTMDQISRLLRWLQHRYYDDLISEDYETLHPEETPRDQCETDF